MRCNKIPLRSLQELRSYPPVFFLKTPVEEWQINFNIVDTSSTSPLKRTSGTRLKARRDGA